MHVRFVDILLPQILADGFIDVIFLEVINLCNCFWALDARIRDGRNLWVGEGGWGFSHDGWLAYVTLCCYEVSIRLLHCWPKVKDAAFQVSAPSLKVDLDFGLRSWLVLKIITSVIIGLGGSSLVPISQEL